MRIVSLLPSATDILFAIGAADDVVGVTFECDVPDGTAGLRIVSGTVLPAGLDPGEIDAMVKARMAAGESLYTLDEGALRSLRPDLVVTQDLCAVCAVDVAEVDAALHHLGCTAEVVTLDPMDLWQVWATVEEVGRVTGHDREAHRLVGRLQDRLGRGGAGGGGGPPA